MIKSIAEIQKRMMKWTSIVQPVLFKSVDDIKKRLSTITVPHVTGVSKNEK